MASLKRKLNAIAATLGAQPGGEAGLNGQGADKSPGAARYMREYRDYAPLPDGLEALNAEALRRVLGEGASTSRQVIPDDFDISRALFIDTETTGLSGGAGTLAFLVGLGWAEPERFVTTQYLALDYAGEPDMLAALALQMERFDYAVTFNGKSFDMPLLETRFTLARMRDQWRALAPIDLLHPARRVWKLRLADCSLSNLEDKVLGMPRQGDIPGAEIPTRYFDFLKTGDMALLDAVISHNRQDIIAMLALLLELNRVFSMGRDIPLVADRFSVGRSLLRGGLTEGAIECFDSVAEEREPRAIAGAAHMQLSLISKRRHNYVSACAHWQAMIDMGEGHVTPYVELAKVCEHRARDFARALALTERAIEIAGGEGPAGILITPLKERRLRLLRKMERQKRG